MANKSFESVHPTEGYNIVVTVDDDYKIERVVDSNKEDVVLSESDMLTVSNEVYEYFDV